MGVLTALLDANVLYPAGLRDFLLRLADRYLYTPLWSADIHAEWMRNLLVDTDPMSRPTCWSAPVRSWTGTFPMPL